MAHAPTQQTGAYLLLIRLRKRQDVTWAGTAHTLAAGYYAYAGSAGNGLRARLARHLRTDRVRHWHVDALLAAGEVVDVQVQFDGGMGECDLVAAWQDCPDVEPLPHFGASDCACNSHAAYSRRYPPFSLLAGTVLARLDPVYRWLREQYVDHAAQDRDPFETLVKCILSLRTQDPVTDAAAERLFAELRRPQEFVAADADHIAELIYPVGFYRDKADRLKEIAAELITRFDGRTPAAIDDLVSLPGVGRKTANLVRSFAFHKPAICVDTHVHRITNRWGLVRTRTPDETEAELRRILPPVHWQETNGFLVQHGQQVCRPTAPRCGACALQPWCCYDHLHREQQLRRQTPGMPPHPSLKLPPPRD